MLMMQHCNFGIIDNLWQNRPNPVCHYGLFLNDPLYDLDQPTGDYGRIRVKSPIVTTD